MQGKLGYILNRQALLYALLCVVAFLVYWATGEGHPTDYNYYVRLADAFLHGRLYLLDNPSWLNELIPFGNGFYVVYPPLVALFGVDLNQTLVSLFFGSATVVLAYFLAT
jgi:hypothetical protein